jgi:hypothetical protein
MSSAFRIAKSWRDLGVQYMSPLEDLHASAPSRTALLVDVRNLEVDVCGDVVYNTWPMQRVYATQKFLPKL